VGLKEGEMRFLPYLEIRRQETEAGHDHFLASCVNLAGEAESEDGVAVYVGQNPESGSRVFLMIDRNGGGELRNSAGTLLAEVDHEDVELLGRYYWLVALS
jgi:hypothetical protein